MKKFTSILTTLVVVVLLTTSMQAQNFENTYTWGNFDHSAWKGMTNYPTGYVIVGSKFFEPQNTTMYITGFNDWSQHQWTIAHPVGFGFSQLDVFWKSFTNMGTPSNPSGYFIATSGTRNGSHQYYTMQTNKTGQRTLERFGALPEGITFGGACQAVNGGYVAVGGNNFGNVAVVKFNFYGEMEWYVVLPYSGFAWTIQPASGGGYVIGSTNRRATRIDHNGNVTWSTVIGLPVSPDGSAYTYTEFEEITPLQNTGTGFAITGSAFSNSTSAVYSARLNWNGTVSWSKINDSQNTALAGTPVAWTNSAVELCNMTTGLWQLVYTWRRGPVSTGGALQFAVMNPSTGANLSSGALNNTIPVQEAFTIRQWLVNRLVVAGTRGGYTGAYSFVRGTPLPLQASDDRSEPVPVAEEPLRRLNVGVSNANPEFEYPVEASRVFQANLQVWPNPAHGQINVGGRLEPGAWVRLIDLQGRVVAEQQLAEGQTQLSFTTGSLRGLYHVQVVGSKSVTSKAVVIE